MSAHQGGRASPASPKRGQYGRMMNHVRKSSSSLLGSYQDLRKQSRHESKSWMTSSSGSLHALSDSKSSSSLTGRNIRGYTRPATSTGPSSSAHSRHHNHNSHNNRKNMGSRGKLLSSSSKSNLLNINVQGTKSHLMNVQGRTYRSGAASSNSRNKLPEFYSNPNSPREGQRGYRGTGQSNGSLPSVGSRTGICSPKKSSAGMTSVGGTSLSQVKPADEDGVIFAVSKKQPGVPFVFRTQTARMVSPERLNLDRRNLAICPVLEGEEQLRLLNFENNNIAKISNLRNLPNLIFLDLYNNQIKEISGLESLGTLRVLMLGKNYIRTVERLECLSKLDVLDLHSNRITKIQNLSHLRDLRVLNLAGNQIDVMENLEGLYSLTELNLRRNNIHTVHGLDQCNSLNRVYLSDNKIASFESLESIFRLNSLAELTLDGNLVASNRYYREYLIDRIKTVKTLDMRRVTDEERRVATMLVRNDEKLEKQRREHLKAERAHTISAIESVWLSKHKRRLSKDRSRSHHNHNVRGPTMKGYYEVKEKTTLLLYGSALDMLTTDNRLFADRERIEKIEIYYCDITSLSENINKLRRFSNANSYAFGHNDIRLFTQLDVLAAFNLKELSVAHNRVCKTTLFRSYIVFKLPTIEILNGKQVSQAERDSAGSKFSLVNSAPMSHLDEILSKRKDKQAATFKEGSKSRKIARHYVDKVLQDVLVIDKKVHKLNAIWPSIVRQIVRSTLAELESRPNVVDAPAGEDSRSNSTSNE